MRVAASTRAFAPVSDRRREDLRFITGAGRYVADLIEPDTLHASFVRSQEAHALITGIDLDEAAGMPGVVAVWTAADITLADHPGGNALYPVENMDRPVLAHERVRYVSEPIAVVLAETERQAVDAAEMVWVDYEPLPPVMDIDAALTDETLLHPDAGTNTWFQSGIGVEAPNFDHEVDIEITVMNDRVGPSSIEPNGIFAKPLGDGAEVWVSAQGAHRIRKPIQDAVGFPVEVHSPDVGGGFGMKGPFYPEYGPVTFAARHFQRPVAWIQTRREHLLGGTHGRSQRHTIRLAGDRSGRIKAAHIRIFGDVGAYGSTGGQVTGFSRRVSLGQYDIADARAEMTMVVTNKAPTGPYRGAGRPESAFAIERAIEVFASACGLDSVDVRLTNYVSSFPHHTVTDALYDSGDYHRTLRTAIDLIGLDEIRHEQQRRRDAGENPIGIGIGSFVERAGGATLQQGEFGRATVTEEGTVIVDTGSVSNGQGHETVWARIAAEALRIPMEAVTVRGGDTTRIPRSAGSSASRSTQIGGSAVWIAAEVVRERAKEVAADLLEADTVDIDVADGVFSVVGVPGSGVTYGEVARHAVTLDVDLTEDMWFVPGAQTFPYGTHIAVVEVDIETGLVDLQKIVAVDDCGNVLNPMIVEGQIHGSLMQGIGQALYEDIDYSPDGQLRTSTFMDYQLPRAADQPEFVLGRVVSPAPSNPLGVKGTGEAGCIGAPPAIVNAVLDALRPHGVTDLTMPLKPATVWEALRGAGSPAT